MRSAMIQFWFNAWNQKENKKSISYIDFYPTNAYVPSSVVIVISDEHIYMDRQI